MLPLEASLKNVLMECIFLNVYNKSSMVTSYFKPCIKKDP